MELSFEPYEENGEFFIDFKVKINTKYCQMSHAIKLDKVESRKLQEKLFNLSDQIIDAIDEHDSGREIDEREEKTTKYRVDARFIK